MIATFARFWNMVSLAIEGLESFIKAFNGLGRLADKGVQRIERELIEEQAQIPSK